MKREIKTSVVAGGLMLLAVSTASAQQTLRIGLQEDPDALDPDQGRSFVGRIVFSALCDKLVDIDPDLNFVPQLATEWSWSDDGKALTMRLREGVVFHDGEPFNAEAVKYNIERSLNLPESRRKSEISEVAGVEAIDKDTVRIDLSQPFAPLLAALSDRAGMMVSPKAAEAAGADFGANPVCSGPFKFAERVAQDRIAVEKFDDYWNADEIHLDRVVYQPIPDTTVRLANLQAGDLDMLERLAPTDIPQVEGDPNLRLEKAVGLGYQGITFNLNNTERAQTPVGQEPLVRQALELAIDRNAINEVVFNGAYTVGNQPVPPTSPYYIEGLAPPERDVERARELLDQAGLDSVPVELMVPNNPEQMQVGQLIQAMAAEAGFDIELVATEFATALEQQTAGNFEAFLIGWSGRVDPDGNIHIFTACEGALNDGKYCNPEVDSLLNEARATTDQEERYEAYEEAAKRYLEDRPRIYLYHPTWLWALRDNVEGFKPYPDGIIRLEGMRLTAS